MAVTSTILLPSPEQRSRKREIKPHFETQMASMNNNNNNNNNNKEAAHRVTEIGSTSELRVGKYCHQCRQKFFSVAPDCRNTERARRFCKIKYCTRCLWNRYGEKTEEVTLLPEWECPKCRGICNCSKCMKRNGKQPTGKMTVNGGTKGDKEPMASSTTAASSKGQKGKATTPAKELEFDAHNPMCLSTMVTEKELAGLKKNYPLLVGYMYRLPEDHERVPTIRGSELALYTQAIYRGLRLPFTRTFIDVLKKLRIHPGQLAPNAVLIFKSTEVLFKLLQVPFNQHIFQYMYVVKLNKSGNYTFAENAPFPYKLEGLDSNIRGWRCCFVKVVKCEGEAFNDYEFSTHDTKAPITNKRLKEDDAIFFNYFCMRFKYLLTENVLEYKDPTLKATGPSSSKDSEDEADNESSPEPVANPGSHFSSHVYDPKEDEDEEEEKKKNKGKPILICAKYLTSKRVLNLAGLDHCYNPNLAVATRDDIYKFPPMKGAVEILHAACKAAIDGFTDIPYRPPTEAANLDAKLGEGSERHDTNPEEHSDRDEVEKHFTKKRKKMRPLQIKAKEVIVLSDDEDSSESATKPGSLDNIRL